MQEFFVCYFVKKTITKFERGKAYGREKSDGTKFEREKGYGRQKSEEDTAQLSLRKTIKGVLCIV